MRRARVVLSLLLAAAAVSVPSLPAEAADPTPGNGRITALIAECDREVGCEYDARFVDPDGSDPSSWGAATPHSSGMAWSPDGASVAYTIARDGGNFLIVDDVADGPDPAAPALASTYGASYGSPPAWSPDGGRLAFRAGSLGRELHVVNADGTGEHVIATDTAIGEPAWGPQGRIAFSRGDGIHTILPDGTDDQLAVESAHSPRWTDDGRIVYRTSTAIVMSNLDGTGKKELLASSVAGWHDFDISPDGDWLAYGGTNDDLYVKDLRTGAVTVVGTLTCGTCRWTNIDWDHAPQVLHPCGGRPDATILGTSGNNTIVGTSGPDVINGFGGNDVINGLGGDDVICGGDGNDLLFGGPGADVHSGGEGIDTASYGGRTVAVNVTIGNGKADDGSLTDGPTGARDSVWGDVENLIGGEAGDLLTGNAAANRLEGRGGNDTLTGGLAADLLFGGGGTDWPKAYDGRRDTRIDCGSGTDKAASYDRGLDPAPVSCP